MIREEAQKDKQSISNIHSKAFEGNSEVYLVDKLREVEQNLISLVFESNNEVLGHILFSPVTISGGSDIKMMGLAPVAVLPTHQKQGIGSALIKAGIESAKKSGVQAIVVLGHADYYPKFGFVPSLQFNIQCEYNVPAENFMILELEEGALSGVSGVAQYHPAFSELE